MESDRKAAERRGWRECQTVTPEEPSRLHVNAVRSEISLTVTLAAEMPQ